MNRVLGLDIGKKRIGIAVSDPLLITAQPLDTILREPEEAALAKIRELCNFYNVNKIIAGLPKNMDGTEGQQALDCKEFAEKITQKTDINVILEDERLTSRQAEFTLRQQNKKYTRNKGMVDKISAILILQQHLDKESKNG
ncbi:MAG: Holliday junction resolvase RuvX [Candidatus Gastranaerophilales bacterium]|nr:Holliday junction resolvase RuvX [Candidatus Gastranaerophilales bacterium]